MEKKELRKKYFTQFNEYKKKNTIEVELSIQQRLFDFFNQKISAKKKNIMAYQPLKSEIPILQLLQGIDCEIFIPEIVEKDLIPKSLLSGFKSDINEMDYVITPGLFVTENGFRLGRGGGYYDRLLNKVPVNKIIFVGYHWQVIKEIPLDIWDKPVGFIITEKNTIICLSRK
ncbi:MAG: hypothetical protein OEV78_06640 [Spirochaetia bacterium]|nr:hypothetical protein [Spirochaetia bacterium]